MESRAVSDEHSRTRPFRSRSSPYHALVSRWITWIPPIVIAVVVGYLRAVVFILRDAGEPAKPR